MDDRVTAPMSSRIRYFFDPVALRDYQPGLCLSCKVKAESVI